MQLDDRVIKIELEGTQLFRLITPGKQALIEETARNFFRTDIQIQYSKVTEQEGSSLKEYEDNEKSKKIETIKEAARQDPLLKNVLRVFPGSRIERITVEEVDDEINLG